MVQFRARKPGRRLQVGSLVNESLLRLSSDVSEPSPLCSCALRGTVVHSVARSPMVVKRKPTRTRAMCARLRIGRGSAQFPRAPVASTFPAVAPASLALRGDTSRSCKPYMGHQGTTMSHENYREKLKIFYGTSYERGASGVTSLAPALPALPEYIGMYTYPYSGGQALVLAVARRDHGVGGGRGGGQYVML